MQSFSDYLFGQKSSADLARQLMKLISEVSRSYITTHVADENTAVFRRPLLRQQIETHRDDVAAIAK